MHFWLGILLTALMGVSLGLLGGGGSILAVPILVHAFGEEAHAAIAISLALVGSTALVAALLHHREGLVDWRAGTLFVAAAAPLSLLGAKAAMRLPGKLLLLLFGGMMLAAGWAMYRRRFDEPLAAREKRVAAMLGCGAVVGFLTGFLGVGGGFIIVPAMVLFLGKPMKQAVGTSLFVIAGNCAIALYGHRAALHMKWAIVLPSTLAALAGTVAGVMLSRRFSPAQVRRAFAALVGLLGAWMVGMNAGALILH
jgi:uncharacterized membrane protein YfcA